jgi:hypothetical protein
MINLICFNDKTNAMKKYILVISLMMSFSAFAQRTDGNEKIESYRVAFITNRLGLTPDESQRFWPVYNAYRRDMKTLRQNFRQEEAEEGALSADQRLQFEQKKLDLKKKYKPEIEAAIGKEKMNLLMQAEDDFKKELVRVMRERR